MPRTNKSHKVPNVKLRPAPAPEHRTQVCDTTWPDNSPDSEIAPNLSMVDLCPRPLKGVTLCATGQLDKPLIFKQAFELGAVCTGDLTDRVTHLIANAHGGAKYTCALERRIPIMLPNWITDAHAIWLRGDDVDVQETISKYRLPIFSGVILSLSGVNDVNHGVEIHRLLTVEQGMFVQHLERPVKVTHLLCSSDTETDKMRYAEKFNNRGEANIHLVWEEWFWDCLEFGGRLDEKKYHVKRPRPERRTLVENEFAIPTHITQCHLQSSSSKPNFVVIDNLNAEFDEEEAAAIRRAPSAALQLWQCLLKSRGFTLDGGQLVRNPSKLQNLHPPQVTPMQQLSSTTNNSKGKKEKSLISTSRCANSFTHVLKEPTPKRPFNRTISLISQPAEDGEKCATFRLFSGYTFRLLGEAQCTNVRLAIGNAGGAIIDDDVTEVDLIIVRLISGSKLYCDEPDRLERSKYRTECWLEQSLFLERICSPQEHVSFVPLTISIPLPDSDKILLSLSGLDESELCWIRRLLRALGIKLASTFSRCSTHLLCPSARGAKFDKALEWGIPVVSMSWLDHMARQGSVPDVTQYLATIPQEDRGRCISSPAKNQVKGKMQVMDSQIMVNDDGRDLSDGMDFVEPNNWFGRATEAFYCPTQSPLPPAPPESSSPNPYMDANAQIPSSRSPSPLKVPSRPPTDATPFACRPDVGQVSKALEKTLTVLLGKRLSSDEDILPQVRKEKRPRPQPSSKAKLHGSIPFPKPIRQSKFDPLCGEDINLLDEEEPQMMEESIRVIYEDPVQLEEKRRLMALHGMDLEEDMDSGGRRTTKEW